MGISVESTVWLFSPLFPVRIGIWKCWFLWSEETLGADKRTNNKLNPHMMPRPGIEPGPHWWEATCGVAMCDYAKQLFLGPSASNRQYCICIVADLFVVRSCLELFCFLSSVSFVLRHLYSSTHGRNPLLRLLYQTLISCVPERTPVHP